MKRDDVLNLRVPSDLKAALRKAAEQDERSMSTMAVRILREWLMAKGYYKSEAVQSSESLVPKRTGFRGQSRAR